MLSVCLFLISRILESNEELLLLNIFCETSTFDGLSGIWEAKRVLVSARRKPLSLARGGTAVTGDVLGHIRVLRLQEMIQSFSLIIVA